MNCTVRETTTPRGRNRPSLAKLGLHKWIVIAVAVCVFNLSGLFTPTSAAQQVVKFKASKPFSSGQVLLRAKLFKPKGGGPFPAIVLMHGCGGWQPAVVYSLLSHADYMVKHGFVVLSLDSFGPRRNSGGKVCESFERLRHARTYRAYDAFDAMRFLQRQEFVDTDNIFLMGQSNGGSVAINVAKASAPRIYGKSATPFRAVVAYYPWCGAFGGSNVALASPLLVFGGGRDDWVPPDECRNVRTRGAELRVQVYPNAAHSFDLNIMLQRYLGKLVGYDKTAAHDSQERMLAFFREHIGVQPLPVAAVSETQTQFREVSFR